ncbi:MAG: glycerol-3-phosphate 1-O-acyltransferase PlsY [Acidimicrobiia bacterium]
MTPWILALVPVAYLMGTFPSAMLVARAAGHDVYAEGSGNPGASNVMRLAGRKAGILVLAVDFAKGAIPALVGLAVAGRAGAYVLGIVAILGHMLPVTHRFRGGKGVATGGGVVTVLFPWITLGLGVVWFVVARTTRKASLASLTAVVLFPVCVLAAGYPTAEVVAMAGLAVLVIARHAKNLGRLIRGEEHSLDAADDAADGPGEDAGGEPTRPG